MAWTGKIVGGVLGSFIGPWGIAIGVGIGHQFDKGASSLQQTGMVIQVAFFGCMAKMAQADGVVSQEEIHAVEQVMTRLGYSPAMREAAISIFREAKDDSHTVAEYAQQLAEATRYNPQIGMTFIVALHAVAQADGIIHTSERDILHQIEKAFRLPPGTIDSMLNQGSSSSSLSDAYQVLGCSPEVSDAEIKKIYRDKCIKFHPDKLASKGLPDEFMEYANEQLARINAAYDQIKKSRG